MNGHTLANHRIFAKDFALEVEKLWLRRSRILILVDGVIDVLPEPAPIIAQEFVISTAFGISTAIATLKNFASGFSSFRVTVATRNGDGSPIAGHDITGFRFSDDSLEAFDQVWLFGFNPGNDFSDSTDPVHDQYIENPLANALSDAELGALAKWMDAGGGVFATGDHHFLGASMCHKVPRVSTMRRWTIAEGVPTQHFATRLDTNRPATPAQAAGTAEIPNNAETDHVPQRTDWVSFSRFRFVRRPHPLLCHPKLGPIDILPDHPHEGLCYDFKAASWQSDKRDLTFEFAGYANDHYPTSGGKRPLPQVVTWGTTLADPPLDFEKGNQPLRHFPQIAAYDGQAIGIGRVVVDSTWHHWFDMNLAGLEQHAQDTFDRSNINRILRYFINVGIYLASPFWRAGQIFGWLKEAQFGYFGQEEISLSAPAVEIGRTALAHLKGVFGPCWVSEFVFDQLLTIDPDLHARLKERNDDPDHSRSELPVELIEEAVLGEVVRAVYSDMDEFREQIARYGQVSRSSLFGDIEKRVGAAAREGLRTALGLHAARLERGREDASRFGGDY